MLIINLSKTDVMSGKKMLYFAKWSGTLHCTFKQSIVALRYSIAKRLIVQFLNRSLRVTYDVCS